MSAKYAVVALIATLIVSAHSSLANDRTIRGEEAERPTARVTVNTGTSVMNRLSAVHSNDSFTCTTTATAMLTRTINQTQPGDIAVQFQSENFPGCRALISLTRNGVLVPGPGDAASPMAMHDTNSELSTNGFNFIANNVPAGAQTFRVLCQCDTGTKLIDERSMTILHR
jgi:hypothetical protein